MRRITGERRRRPTPIVSRHTFFGGRRRAIRRNEDKRRHFFVDHYNLQLFITLLALFILSVLDASLTLELVRSNIAAEANPVMALYLEHGSITFLLEKFLFTSVAVLIFCVFNHFLITKISLILVTVLYFGVVFYEVSMMNSLFPQFFSFIH